ncbi:Gfo/Idh/MocA family protein [Streptomyces sp. NPDC002537]
MTAAVRMGVLGCASIARRRVLPAMKTCPDVELVAVAGRDAATARATAEAFGCDAEHGYAALLERADIDAVYVPLPTGLHGAWVAAALRAGKHVLAEKPLTTGAEETRRLARLAAAKNLALAENVMFVHHSQHAAVRRLVADGAIGQPRVLQATFTIPRLPDGDIRLDPALGGGALWDTGVYPVRAALHLLGDRLRVAGSVSVRDQGYAVDTSGAALLHTPEGVTAHLTYGFDHAYRSAYTIWGSTGRITVDRAFTPPADHVPSVLLERPDGTERLDLAPDDQVQGTLSAFARAARASAPLSPVVLRQADLLDELRRRGTTG